MNRRMFYILFLSLLTSTQFVSVSFAQEKGKLNIVTTQTMFADLVKQIGGDKVNVSAVVSPKYNIHFIQPKPSDVRRVTQADLYVNAGLDLEAWSDPLLEAAGNPKLFRQAERNLDLSSGIQLLNMPNHAVTRAEGDIHLFGNPHFHMNPENAKIMVRTIVEKLKEIDPNNAAVYETNAENLLKRLDQKITEWKSMCAGCRNKEMLSYHDDIVYLADFLGIKVEQFLESKPGIPPTPKHLQFLENYVKKNQVKAIVLPTYYSHREADKLAQKVGVKVVTICQSVGELPGTDNFFDFFDYNVKQMSEAVR